MSPNANVTKTQTSPKCNYPKTQMSPKRKYHLNAIVTKTQMSPKRKCHYKANVIKLQMSPKLKYHDNWNVSKTWLSPKRKCHQNANVTKTQILPLGLTFPFIYLPNGSGTIRCPGLVLINPNGLWGHGLSDSRLLNMICLQLLQKKGPFIFED